MTVIEQSPWALLTFLAAPAILTNASTVLALGTSNRLARASDRARAASSVLLGGKSAAQGPLAHGATERIVEEEFDTAARRAAMLVQALRRFYLAAGCFAAAACIALLGAVGAYFDAHALDVGGRVLAIAATMAGVASLVSGTLRLVAETRVALASIGKQVEAVEEWRRTRETPPVQPGV
jgi:hypothetical protein